MALWCIVMGKLKSVTGGGELELIVHSHSISQECKKKKSKRRWGGKGRKALNSIFDILKK